MSQAQYELLSELRYSLRLFAGFSEAAAKAAGITPTQHQALLAIKAFGASGLASIGDLAERLCIRHHSAVGLVDRLMSAGFVRRAQDAADRRRVRVVLSARGERTLEKLSIAHRDELRRIGPQVEALLERLRRGSTASG
jgi:DNA-binding MarR family transcriptional regulator